MQTILNSKRLIWENYLNSLTKKEEKDIKVSPFIERLTRVIPKEGNDYKNDYYEYLDQKYS
ncbi:DUF6364 family protein [Niabella aquatica]